MRRIIFDLCKRIRFRNVLYQNSDLLYEIIWILFSVITRSLAVLCIPTQTTGNQDLLVSTPHLLPSKLAPLSYLR